MRLLLFVLACSACAHPRLPDSFEIESFAESEHCAASDAVPEAALYCLRAAQRYRVRAYATFEQGPEHSILWTDEGELYRMVTSKITRALSGKSSRCLFDKNAERLQDVAKDCQNQRPVLLSLPSVRLSDVLTHKAPVQSSVFAAFTTHDNEFTARERETMVRETKCQSITVERSPCCMGIRPCPEYRLTLTPNGRALLDPGRNARVEAPSVGQVSPQYFAYLCQIVHDSHQHWSSRWRYRTSTGSSSLWLRVVDASGETMVRRREGPSMPQTVAVLASEFSKIFYTLDWTPLPFSKDDTQKPFRFSYAEP